ncbi:MAG: heavy metal translocating P-type ATPase [Candidatus Bipolaricaulia bacterium]
MSSNAPTATITCDRCRQSGSHFWLHAESLFAWGAGAFLLLGLATLVLWGNAPVIQIGSMGLGVSTLLLLGAVAVGSVPIGRHALESVIERRLGINLLMAVAIVGAVAIGETIEAASLAFLFLLAERLEDYAVERSHRSLQELVELAPQQARVLTDDGEVTRHVEAISVEDHIAVRPGERIPLDGVIMGGKSSVDEATITGESLPSDKSQGDEVFAGTLNQSGYLEIRVSKRADDTTLARVIQLVSEAEEQKAPIERFVDQFGRIYTPAVVGVAVGVATIPTLLLNVPFETWFLRAITLLVIACPCAMVISTPVSVVSAISSAARRGVLIKGGQFLESLGEVRAIAFDKTGTLTTGELAVTDVVPLNGYGESDVLRFAASLEGQSEHPIAQAILQSAPDERLPQVEDFEAMAGRGVQGRVEGTRYDLGTPALFQDRLHDVPQARVDDLQRAGKTTMLLGTDAELIGLIGVADEVRPEARSAVRELQSLGIEVAMFTGDNAGTARAIADQLGIERYHAELLPEQKLTEIERLSDEYGNAAMIGDGINDAPALARSTIGIAMGAAGSDTALETADVALMADDLGQVPELVRLSRRSRSVIRQNIASAIIVKLALGLAVFPGWVSLVAAVLIGDMGMTLGVTGNAMRLARSRALSSS